MPQWAKSKTVWLGVVVEMLGVIQMYSEELRVNIPPEYYGYFLVALGIIIKILRYVTTLPVNAK